MQVGDLVQTNKGNYAFVKEIQPSTDWRSARLGPEWINIVFVSSGHLRTGYPTDWIVKVNGKRKKP